MRSGFRGDCHRMSLGEVASCCLRGCSESALWPAGRRSSDDGAMKQQPAVSSVRVTTGVPEFAGSHDRSQVNGLPRILHAQRSTVAQTSAPGAAEWLPMTITAIEEELRHPSIASAVMLAKIADLLFIWAICHWPAEVLTRRAGLLRQETRRSAMPYHSCTQTPGRTGQLASLQCGATIWMRDARQSA